MSPEQQFVRQKIPVEIERGKPLTIQICSLSGNGANDVAIRCPPDVWNAVTNAEKVIHVRLRSSSKPGTEIGGVDPGGAWGFIPYVSNAHYLFYIGGTHRAKASVEIVFPNAPPGTTRAEILVGKTPIDTKFPNY
jgi:hypothetical protein